MANATLRYQEFRSSGVKKEEGRRKKEEGRNFSPTPPTPLLPLLPLLPYFPYSPYSPTPCSLSRIK